ncbi:uncharacterized protein LOC115151382 [Salmo trutta]|uniref:uncharacterized protein LOC115151382 n=1 Tax=Salmo trutta TaxID=8032 RepID=UPI001131D745|nr:uncharacterized protein LOC115151382 [Salmo trutta]
MYIIQLSQLTLQNRGSDTREIKETQDLLDIIAAITLEVLKGSSKAFDSVGPCGRLRAVGYPRPVAPSRTDRSGQEVPHPTGLRPPPLRDRREPSVLVSRMPTLYSSVLAMELLAACQGIEFFHPLLTTTPLEKVYDLVRSVTKALDQG